jgi:hypothetical protein
MECFYNRLLSKVVFVGHVRRVVRERRKLYEGEFAFAHQQAWECLLHRGCHELSGEWQPGPALSIRVISMIQLVSQVWTRIQLARM